jgi:hypothetical protein
MLALQHNIRASSLYHYMPFTSEKSETDLPTGLVLIIELLKRTVGVTVPD